MDSNVIIIAEAGVNHNGNLDLAKKLVSAAKATGADYVKFQTWKTEELVTKSAPKAEYQKQNDKESDSQYEMLKRLELSYNDFREIKRHADTVGIGFASTPDDEVSLNFLVDEIGMDFIKVGSGEVTNILYLRKIAKKKKPVILSTGMSYLSEVERAYRTLIEYGAPKVTVLHCTSAYPAPMETANIRAMRLLADSLGCAVGYSDHMQEDEASLAAVVLGATVVEKHITLDRHMAGPDHSASLDQKMFTDYVRKIRNIGLAVSGSGRKEPQEIEKETKKVVQRGLYAADSLNEGVGLDETKLKALRPCVGIPAELVDLVIGAKLKNKKEKGSPITWNDLEFL
jgi:N,N'-diacetyllegionaminate synthase